MAVQVDKHMEGHAIKCNNKNSELCEDIATLRRG
jgi:hypothetical protein